jgi:hypothetical protein
MRDLHGRYRIVVGFITTYVLINTIMSSIQHYVIKFVSKLQQVGGFLRVLSFPEPIKLTATI